MRVYDWNELDQIAFELKNNKAAIVETDTVMGIISLNDSLIYNIKKRSKNKKLIRLVVSTNDVPKLNETEKKVVNKYWPGELTIIKHQIGYRIPNHAKLLKLLKKVNGVFSSSANLSGEAPIYNSEEALSVFKKHPFDLIIVKGKQQNDHPSTIVDFDKIKIIRVGVIDPEPIINELKKEKGQKYENK
ncbi:MAG: Sua5/YciO/YrdC/YwlC family protein [Mycoplasmataceae bacterium]|nr:Sua5/YciO/YrdC/YwlC family protein [Mycoplasmataceae bacterium]